MNHIRRYYFTCASGNKYSLKLSCNYKRDSDGKYHVNFVFKRCNKDNNTILFYNAYDKDAFFPSPLIRNPIGIQSAYALLGFLTLRYGDTDQEHFNNYSPSQKAFSQSFDCEELQILVYDYENKK